MGPALILLFKKKVNISCNPSHLQFKQSLPLLKKGKEKLKYNNTQQQQHGVCKPGSSLTKQLIPSGR